VENEDAFRKNFVHTMSFFRSLFRKGHVGKICT